MQSIALTAIAEKLELKSLTPEMNIENIEIVEPDINRPALQLAGFFDHFDSGRVQVIGHVEHTFVQTLEKDVRIKRYEQLLSHNLPCVIFCRDLIPDQDFMDIARDKNIPVFSTGKVTFPFIAEIVALLYRLLSPSMTVHGVLVDVYGEGILIMGESGIGKSEAALELIRRGHRLVADDVVELHRVTPEQLIGRSPDITRHFIEVRGIGILDVKTLFGVGSVKDEHPVDIVIKFEDWDRERKYDRLGLEDEYMEFLGNKVVAHAIPIRPGRNLAVIVESAAINCRQKKMGYNAAQELYKRVQENINRKK
ncbi:HPr(Ser) kinase/phosphatase [Parasporobacterium paucivorans]|uniref:HPr kinase/phosphorylase n=1 Tax=Parasporobacterium paucivorans DSM 15970 TaxID=1122934 RepID=A0A1M6JQ51_9FIRM|nr:HPr(Ser) kinase/phosphatase [Parasporobacterium paucivorans]SHJ48713.1 Hpr(Ser) kinase/phosphatase [Parasporobacterium paucivorans DSM 15970]